MSQVKQEFENVLSVRDNIESVFGLLSNKLKTLKDIYSDIVKNHASNEFSFGTDSFYFQNQLIETDNNKLHGIFIDIDNQIYCEYFNLYRIVKEYASKELTTNKTKRSANFSMTFETFKRINSTKHYSIAVVKEMHDAISAGIIEIETYLSARKTEVTKDEEQSRQGLNIDNLVYAEMYKNSMMEAKIRMFYQYMNAFNLHHNKYYTRLLLKVKMQHGIVNEDINIKQFGGADGRTSVKELSALGGSITQPCAIDEEETEQIKTYIGYDNLQPSNQSMFNNIMVSAGSTSSHSSETSEDHSPKPVVKHLPDTPPVPDKKEHIFNETDVGKKAKVTGYDSDGTIVFVGEHHVNKTLRVGVVFDKPIGKMNGCLDGHKYFECEENMGLLAVPYKVNLL